MVSSSRHSGDNRLWAVLFFAGVILAITAFRAIPRAPLPAPDLVVIGDVLQLVTNDNIDEADEPSLLTNTGGAATPFFFAPVPVNSANSSLLMTLPGIGKGLAQKIISFRDQRGPIASPEEFTRIGGIGAKRVKTLEHLITFR